MHHMGALVGGSFQDLEGFAEHGARKMTVDIYWRIKVIFS